MPQPLRSVAQSAPTVGKRQAARLSLHKSRFFLILGLATQFGSEANPRPETLTTCSNPDALLKIVSVISKRRDWWSHGDKDRVLIELKTRRLPIAGANRIVSAIGALFSHVHHTAYHDLASYQIPKVLIKETEVSAEDLEELEALVGKDSDPLGIATRLGSCVMIPPPHTATIFYLLPFVLQNPALFDACSFFRSSCSEYSFMDGVVRDVLNEPKRRPETEIERLAWEHVVLQSFRAIEALVGEPGKNLDRFRERLRDWGLDYHERVGFPGRAKQRLEDRILWLQDARDSAAAHGKRRRLTPFTLFEAMEAQHLADHILHTALWSTAESLGRQGAESEIAFLLEEMFTQSPWNLVWNPGWSKKRELFNGKRAVDLARAPGGLAKIVKAYKTGLAALNP